MAQISNIREHMQVVGSDGAIIGLVDRSDGDRIKLTKSDSPDGRHHFIDASLIERVDARIHLSARSDEVMSEWDDDDLTLEDDETEIEEDPEQREKEWTERTR